MRELFSVAFFLGDWNFVLGAEVHLGSWLLGLKYTPADKDAICVERELTFHLPTLSFTLAWIDDENVERKQEAYDLLSERFPATGEEEE